jgi:hypothetical protein
MTDPRDPLARPRALARLLDTAVRIPGTNMRFGLDPLLGVVPGLGDLAGAALSGHLVLVASRLGAPRSVIVRMIGNVAIDTLGGTIPLVGDLFDAGWKANTRNLELLDRHLGRPTTEPSASFGVVAAMIGGLVLIAVVGVAAAVLLARAVWIALR